MEYIFFIKYLSEKFDLNSEIFFRLFSQIQPFMLQKIKDTTELAYVPKSLISMTSNESLAIRFLEFTAGQTEQLTRIFKNFSDCASFFIDFLEKPYEGRSIFFKIYMIFQKDFYNRLKLYLSSEDGSDVTPDSLNKNIYKMIFTLAENQPILAIELINYIAKNKNIGKIFFLKKDLIFCFLSIPFNKKDRNEGFNFIFLHSVAFCQLIVEHSNWDEDHSYKVLDFLLKVSPSLAERAIERITPENIYKMLNSIPKYNQYDFIKLMINHASFIRIFAKDKDIFEEFCEKLKEIDTNTKSGKDNHLDSLSLYKSFRKQVLSPKIAKKLLLEKGVLTSVSRFFPIIEKELPKTQPSELLNLIVKNNVKLYSACLLLIGWHFGKSAALPMEVIQLILEFIVGDRNEAQTGEAFTKGLEEGCQLFNQAIAKHFANEDKSEHRTGFPEIISPNKSTSNCFGTEDNKVMRFSAIP